MGSAGENLKSEREARGISLREISEHTKISVRFLKAIEEEKLEMLPGGIFNKSFVRHYAAYLGLDEQQTVAEYFEEADRDRDAATPLAAALPKEGMLQPASGNLPLIFAAFVLGIIVVVGIAYIIYRFTYREAISASPTAVPAAPDRPSSGTGSRPEAVTGAPSGAAARPLLEKAPTLAAAIEETRQERGSRMEPAPASLLLEIGSLRAVWLSVTADGDLQWEGILEPQQSRRVGANEIIQMHVGDAGGLTLTLNGNPLPSAGDDGEVKRLTISADGFTELAQ